MRTVGIALLIVAAAGGIWLAHRRGAFAASWAKLQALQQSPSWDWWVAALFAMLGVLGILILWKVPQWQVARVEGLDSEKRFDKRNEARKTLATILGGIAFLTGGYFTWRNFNLAQENLKVTEQGQITDRYTKAIEQLGAVDSKGGPRLEVRLGAIYSLEAIANESRSFHWPIMEVLCTYVRMNAPAEREESQAKPTSAAKQMSRQKPVAGDELHPRADIQAILTVLGRRDRKFEPPEQYLDLAKTDLSGGDLHGAQLDKADLSWAHLEHMDLSGAHLSKAHLANANLQNAVLIRADVDQADLTSATLTGRISAEQTSAGQTSAGQTSAGQTSAGQTSEEIILTTRTSAKRTSLWRTWATRPSNRRNSLGRTSKQRTSDTRTSQG